MDEQDINLRKSIEEALDVLTSFSIPLYQLTDGRPELHGTGFFVRVGFDHFLVSAAHVLDTAAASGLYFYSRPNEMRRLTGQVTRSPAPNGRNADLVDIGIVKLAETDYPPFPEVGKFAMDASQLHQNLRPREGKSYALIGFPGSKSRASNQDRTVLAAPYAFRFNSLPESRYASLGIDPESHIALELNLRRGFDADGNHQHFPKPQGMSGSPLLILYSEASDDRDHLFPVVGVATTYLKGEKALIATDISFVIGAIERIRQSTPS
jgi:hypothetical protein